MFEAIKQEIQAVQERDPAARGALETLLVSSGLHAILLHRPAHWLYQRRRYLAARLISQFSRFLTGIEIHPGAKIGRGVLIDHGMGVVIGETAEVGDGCTLYQGVTLGGTGKDHGKRHPTLGKNVLVGSGAKILGPFTVGDNAKIAAGAVVLEPIPPDSTAVGVPAHVVRRNGQRTCKPMDQVHIPDPVSQEFCRLAVRLERAERKIEQQQKELDALRARQSGGTSTDEAL